MNKPCQHTQACDFRNAHHAAVMAAQKEILDAGKHLLAIAHEVLPDDVKKAAEVELKQSNVRRFIQMIRPTASSFISAGLSNTFWDMVDAANFFTDAVDTDWPYMTMEKRTLSLKWAANHASLVKHGETEALAA